MLKDDLHEYNFPPTLQVTVLILEGLYCFYYNSIVKMTQYKAEEILEALSKELMLEFNNSLSSSIYTKQII